MSAEMGILKKAKGCPRRARPELAALYAVALKELVLLAAPALRALQAAHKKKGNRHRDQNGQQVGVRLKPVGKDTHIFYATTYPRFQNRAIARGSPEPGILGTTHLDGTSIAF
jgi:hypothetical protein